MSRTRRARRTPARHWTTNVSAVVLPLVAALGLASCGARLGSGSGPIEVSGSSTVAPITTLVAREGGFDVTVEAEGTGSGFERFCAGETAINNASTAIPGAGQPVDYVAQCEQSGIEFLELPIGLDAISVVRNSQASFVDELTRAELRSIWAADSGVSSWSQVRAEWPDEPIGLYGRPDTSGTHASFSHAITQNADGLRTDYTATDDLAQLSQWIADDPGGLGYMGVGNYLSTTHEHQARVTTVAVDGLQPSLADAQSGRYGNLTRPLFLYVSTKALEDEGVARFVEYYLESAPSVLPRTYFYPLDRGAYIHTKERFAARTAGTVYGGDPFASIEAAQVP
ncbi:phosphate transport system substrate-binding protein [Kineosphaera limosa]|uniref:Putative ABC transporter substrate-binding protein n=1 Tax=Kineosphaera limosa NBRC 100340 TaxID=1184609 RepID=K6WD17_9MICO|nr:substrate-binding domain-containing protein [Kineosphaera limosa]NYE02524.1 phosphate transport system substrate-binding protein [Kineosphaera limosa]GAB97175.1 putative ABC transporter substrate-binding protein [Kineosphaera limosa NBRC 100340]